MRKSSTSAVPINISPENIELAQDAAEVKYFEFSEHNSLEQHQPKKPDSILHDLNPDGSTSLITISLKNDFNENKQSVVSANVGGSSTLGDIKDENNKEQGRKNSRNELLQKSRTPATKRKPQEINLNAEFEPIELNKEEFDQEINASSIDHVSPNQSHSAMNIDFHGKSSKFTRICFRSELDAKSR